jgi:hypothetical protein
LRYSLSRANARTFKKELNCEQCLFFRDCHGTQQTCATLCVSLAALTATKTAKAASLLPELQAFDVTSSAIHIGTLQRALAVCQGETIVQIPSLREEISAKPQTSGVI